jgi:hypothetical protein
MGPEKRPDLDQIEVEIWRLPVSPQPPAIRAPRLENEWLPAVFLRTLRAIGGSGEISEEGGGVRRRPVIGRPKAHQQKPMLAAAEGRNTNIFNT